METVQIVVSLVVGILAGGVVSLKYIAPKTKTTADDKVLEKLLALEAFIEKLLPLVKVEPPAKDAPESKV